jgi:hypothetical protein
VSDVRLRPEFTLLARCCRWNFQGDRSPAPVELPADVDWMLVVTLARRHRVQGLAWAALARQADRLPDDATAALSSDARAIAATNLGIAGECRELLEAFERSKIALMFIKGLAVGALAYRSPLLKMGWDIDLLISPDDLEPAAILLTERGYRPSPPTSLANLHAWHGLSKESLWRRDDSFHVELHTRLADNRGLIPTIEVHSARQMVEIAPGIGLPTLAADELFAYLAVHGASSAWFRLKWLSDFAALLAGRSGQDIARLYRRSQELGAARAAGQALLLADRLFDVLAPIPGLREELRCDWRTRLLCSAALRMMTEETGEPTDRPLGTLAIHWTQLLLKPGFEFMLSELWRQGSGVLSRIRH